jgi:hypothetical protein
MSAASSRRQALGVLAGAGAMLIGQKQAVAKDIAGGGLPGGLQEFFGLMQTKKQVKYIRIQHAQSAWENIPRPLA